MGLPVTPLTDEAVPRSSLDTAQVLLHGIADAAATCVLVLHGKNPSNHDHPHDAGQSRPAERVSSGIRGANDYTSLTGISWVHSMHTRRIPPGR